MITWGVKRYVVHPSLEELDIVIGMRSHLINSVRG